MHVAAGPFRGSSSQQIGDGLSHGFLWAPSRPRHHRRECRDEHADDQHVVGRRVERSDLSGTVPGYFRMHEGDEEIARARSGSVSSATEAHDPRSSVASHRELEVANRIERSAGKFFGSG